MIAVAGGVAGALGFTIARSRFAFSILNPIAPSETIASLFVLNAPPTPTNRFTFSSFISIMDASIKSGDVRAGATGPMTPSPSTSTSTVRLTMVNVPWARTKPEISSATVPDAFNSKSDVSFPFGSVLNPGRSPVLLANALVQSRRVVARPAASLALFT